MIISLTGIVLTALKREQPTGGSTSGKRDASFATGAPSVPGRRPSFGAQARLASGPCRPISLSRPPPRPQSSQIPNDDREPSGSAVAIDGSVRRARPALAD